MNDIIQDIQGKFKNILKSHDWNSAQPIYILLNYNCMNIPSNNEVIMQRLRVNTTQFLTNYVLFIGISLLYGILYLTPQLSILFVMNIFFWIYVCSQVILRIFNYQIPANILYTIAAIYCLFFNGNIHFVKFFIVIQSCLLMIVAHSIVHNGELIPLNINGSSSYTQLPRQNTNTGKHYIYPNSDMETNTCEIDEAVGTHHDTSVNTTNNNPNNNNNNTRPFIPQSLQYSSTQLHDDISNLQSNILNNGGIPNVNNNTNTQKQPSQTQVQQSNNNTNTLHTLMTPNTNININQSQQDMQPNIPQYPIPQNSMNPVTRSPYMHPTYSTYSTSMDKVINTPMRTGNIGNQANTLSIKGSTQPIDTPTQLAASIHETQI